jgi:hypothetical protein
MLHQHQSGCDLHRQSAAVSLPRHMELRNLLRKRKLQIADWLVLRSAERQMHKRRDAIAVPKPPYLAIERPVWKGWLVHRRLL